MEWLDWWGMYCCMEYPGFWQYFFETEELDNVREIIEQIIAEVKELV